MQKKLPISAFIIAFNEENNLRACLQSLSFCAEIIVVDSGSDDKTIQIAEEMGAKVYYRKFTGYTEQKQYALNQCKYEWVFSLDADERISDEIYKFLLNFDFEKSPFDGYEFRRLHYFEGKFIKHSGLYPDYKLRFFRKDKGQFKGENIHEVVELNGRTKKLPLNLLHYSWKDFKDYLIRQLSYSERVAINKAYRGVLSNPLEAVLKAKFTFFYRYFFRLGFLDGWLGFIICLGAAIATFYKYLKIWELSFPSPYNFLFSPISLVYDLIIKCRLKAYELGLLKKHKLPIKVISVGNLSVGGSGKTPLTLALAKALSKKNKTVILMRGYKSKIDKKQIHHVKPSDKAELIGDEAYMLFSKLQNTNINIVIAPNRFLGGQFAINNLKAEVLILDDGFQHLSLERDLNICLIDCSDPYSTKLLPTGSLREDFKQIERANYIVLTRSNNPLKNKYLNLIQKYAPNTPTYELKESLSFSQNLKDKKALVFCGLGNPRQFVMALKEYSLQIQKTIIYPDHFAYSEKDLENIHKELRACEADIAITTSKDASKINLNNLPFELAIAELEFNNFEDLKVSLQNEFGDLF